MIRFITTFACLFLLSVPLQAATLLQGNASYWNSFVKYWERQVATQDGVVMTALLVGAIGIFIITRGKWIK